jgi:hypothetical protein
MTQPDPWQTEEELICATTSSDTDLSPAVFGKYLEVISTLECLTITDTTPAPTYIGRGIVRMIGALLTGAVLCCLINNGIRMHLGQDGTSTKVTWIPNPTAINDVYGTPGVVAAAGSLCIVIAFFGAGVMQIRRARTGGAVFVFDRASDRLERSGRLLGPMSGITQVVVKQITRDGEPGLAYTVCRVIIHTRDNSQITINDDDLNQATGQALAERVASFVGVPLHDANCIPSSR